MSILKSIIKLNVIELKIKNLLTNAESFLNKTPIDNNEISNLIGKLDEILGDNNFKVVLKNPNLINELEKIKNKLNEIVNHQFKKDKKEGLIAVAEDYNKTVKMVKDINEKIINNLKKLALPSTSTNQLKDILEKTNQKLNDVDINKLKNVTYFDEEEWKRYIAEIEPNYYNIINVLSNLSSIYSKLAQNGWLGNAFQKLKKEGSIRKFNKYIINSNNVKEYNDTGRAITQALDILQKINHVDAELDKDIINYLSKNLKESEIKALEEDIKLEYDLTKFKDKLNVLKQILQTDLRSMLKYKNKNIYRNLYQLIVELNDFFKKHKEDINIFIIKLKVINKISDNTISNQDVFKNLNDLENKIKNIESLTIDLNTYSFLKNMDKAVEDELKESEIEQKKIQLLNIFNENKKHKPDFKKIDELVKITQKMIIEEKSKNGKIDDKTGPTLDGIVAALDALSMYLFKNIQNKKIHEIDYFKEGEGAIKYLLEVKKIVISYLQLRIKELRLKIDELKKTNSPENQKKVSEYEEIIKEFESAMNGEIKSYENLNKVVFKKKISKYKENKYKNIYEKMKNKADSESKAKKIMLKILAMGSEYLKQLKDIIDQIEIGIKDVEKIKNIDNELEQANASSSTS